MHSTSFWLLAGLLSVAHGSSLLHSESIDAPQVRAVSPFGNLPNPILDDPLRLANPLSKRTKNCPNSPSDRTCWGQYDITTNYYDTVPNTGKTREYWFNLIEKNLSPDGVPRYTQTINGSLPGPTIEADWGDRVVIHLTNSLKTSTNGTTLHFHGIRQNYTNPMDGTPSITQCPVAPGKSMTYSWRATQYGTSFYHSHFGLQAWEGLFGGIKINGPATANYDVDLGNLFLNDWLHATPDATYASAQTQGPPTEDNGLINGTNVFGTAGSRFKQTFKAGTRYRIRLVNAAIETHFKFSIDNHTLTVISNDFVPIKPYTTNAVSIGIGQRYDIIVTANQPANNYWMRAIPQLACSYLKSADLVRGIIRYNSSSTADPTSKGYTLPNDCNDESPSKLIPYLALNAGATKPTSRLTTTVGPSAADPNIFKWYFNTTTFYSDWSNPSLAQIYTNKTTNWTFQSGAIELPNPNSWAVIVIETAFPAPHPMHLHGHDFYLLGAGVGAFNTSIPLTTQNPPRRDVAMLPANGYMVLAFLTDNPGVWLLHCHIGWHTSQGMDLQFIEREKEIKALIDSQSAWKGLNQTCANWKQSVKANSVVQDDSGV
ncbi:hypothetical protein FH972_024605 [Carpinus fangiana]|uniref:Laccase n=1 Tax=Carpinus fangiana TaxID=176857 RepID=A0A5N6KYT4_9ROSI|nr:hypothetical protein FH972_024605 [Carpinus fangiana]